MTDQRALVSIIVPVYGTEAYLTACIDSIRNQSYPHLQIILVDDQSPDCCPEICDAYAGKDERILAVHQKNKGVSGARNTGLCHVAGDYVMFVDSDDVLYPTAVETLLQDAEEYQADLVSATMVSAENTIICGDEKCAVYCGDTPLLLSLAGDVNMISVCAKLFKAPFLQDMFFEEGKNIHEDGFFMFQCCLKKPVVVYHNIPVYLYNSRKNSASRQTFSEKYISMLYFCNRKKAILSASHPQLIDQVRNMEARTNLEMLQILCSTTDKHYRCLQRYCVNKVHQLRKYHRPANAHHKRLAWIVLHGLYPVYKLAVRMKYYR